MRAKRVLGWAAAAAAALAILPGCGKNFPIGEKLLPQSYGPPFGDEVARNQVPHPHGPGSSERHSASDSVKNKTYKSHAACRAALQAAVRPHGAPELVTISSVEAIAHHEESGEVHEHRCTDYVLSHRSWCKFGLAEAQHSKMSRKPEAACKSQAGDHH
jgi:hypothetical protein